MSNASITAKYTSFILIDVDRGPCIDKHYSRQHLGGWVGLTLYAISIQKKTIDNYGRSLKYTWNRTFYEGVIRTLSKISDLIEKSWSTISSLQNLSYIFVNGLLGHLPGNLIYLKNPVQC